MKITGTLQALTARPVNTRYGVKPSYEGTIDGTKVSFGFKKPTADNGDTVTVETDDGKYNNVVNYRVEAKATAPAAFTARPTTAPPVGPTAKAFPVPLLHPDRSIIRQNALAHATKIYCDCATIVTQDKANREELAKQVVDGTFAERIIATARLFEEYASGFSELKAAAEVTKEVANPDA